MFAVGCPADVADLVADRLWGLGVAGIEEGTDGIDRRLLRSSLGEDRDDVEERLRAALVAIPDIAITFEAVDESISETWRDHVRDVVIDDGLRILPNWLAADATPTERITIRIEPGSTFGLGDHPTTRASLLALRRHLAPGDDVLDVGCGSGVLGVTSLVCGAGSAIGIDINPAAEAVSRSNAALNDVSAAWQVLISDVDDALVHDLLARRPHGFQLVLANILAPVLVTMAPHLVRLISPGGTLVLSGVLSGRYEHVLSAFASLRTIERFDVEGWTAVVLGHDTSASISSR